MLGIHSQTLPFSHICLHLADELGIKVLCINSAKAFTLAGGHISRQRMAPFLSYHNHLGLSVWCCLPNPSPQATHSSPNPPPELALRFHPACQERALLVQDQRSSGGCLACPRLLPSCQALWEAAAALVSGHCAPPRLLSHEDE